MFDTAAYLKSLRRPGLLVRTAKLAMSQFNREAILFKIFGFELSDDPNDVIKDLIEREDEINVQRKTGDVTYNIARHISILTALMHEADTYLHRSDAPT